MAKGPNTQFADFPFVSVIVDTILHEDTSGFLGNYNAVEPGTPFNSNDNTHSVADVAKYSGTISLGQRLTGDGTNEWFRRFWATLPHTQDIYNYQVGYDQEAGAFPIFRRHYLETRDQYPLLKRTRLTPLTGLYGITITAAGAGYSIDPANPPTVAISDSGTGTGATAIAVVNPADGSISKITLKAEGVNYTPATVTVTITDIAGGVGAGAAATAIIQTTNCLLIKEEGGPGPAPWDALCLLIERTYKTLPGPVVTELKPYGTSGIPILVSTQEVAANVVFSPMGEFQPSAITVNSITAAASPIVTLPSDPGLPIGAFVTFSGTSATPSLNGTPLQIIAIPGTNQVQVTPASAITGAQVAPAGTMQSTHRIVRELHATENSNVKNKVESIIGVADVSTFNESVLIQKSYPFPDYLKGINFYRDPAVSQSTPLSPNASSNISWGGGVGLDIQPGYRGPCPAIRKLFYFSGPPPDSFGQSYSPTLIIPSVGTFVIQGGASGTKGLPTLYDDISASTSFRTGVIPPVLHPTSVPITTIDGLAGAMNITGITAGNAGGSPYTIVAVDVNHGLTTGMMVRLLGTAIDGTYAIVSTPALNSVAIAVTTGNHGAGGTMGIAAQAAFGTGVASLNVTLSKSVPPMIISTLAIVSIGTGTSPLITVGSAHYLQIGQYIQLTSTGTAPSLDGIWRITAAGTTTIAVTPGFNVTGSSSGVGTLQNIITIVEEPQKQSAAALWECYVWLILVPYYSGQTF